MFIDGEITLIDRSTMNLKAVRGLTMKGHESRRRVEANAHYSGHMPSGAPECGRPLDARRPNREGAPRYIDLNAGHMFFF